jgi:hypothetical protein
MPMANPGEMRMHAIRMLIVIRMHVVCEFVQRQRTKTVLYPEICYTACFKV